MKINFITGELAPDGKWNVRHVWHKGRRIRSEGTYLPAGCSEIEFKENKEIRRTYKENHITIVKQPNILRTIFILMHELSHWAVDKVYRKNYLARKKWHKKIDDHL